MMSNPFLFAFSQSDLFGKLIFIGLFVLSIGSWTLIVHKFLLTRSWVRLGTYAFRNFVPAQPLSRPKKATGARRHNPYTSVGNVLNTTCLDVLTKNQALTGSSTPYLSASDVDAISDQVEIVLADETHRLERHLYLLSTTVSLAPFLGLLGTVWGILVTFADLQNKGTGGGNEMALGGLSMALATTVIGLLVAIPALVGNNYLRASIKGIHHQLRDYAARVLGAVELQYRSVDK